MISLQSKGLSRVFSSTTVQKHQFFSTQLCIVQLSHPYMTTGKTIALTRQNFVGKVMSLLFTMLSGLVRAFLPREGTYVYLWLIHIVVWKKPIQHCKAIILQLKINFKKITSEKKKERERPGDKVRWPRPHFKRQNQVQNYKVVAEESSLALIWSQLFLLWIQNTEYPSCGETGDTWD